MSDTFLPDLLKQMPLGRRLRIWSAACSTGEEPYSLAIVLKERMGKVLYSWDVGILATEQCVEHEGLALEFGGLIATRPAGDPAPRIAPP